MLTENEVRERMDRPRELETEAAYIARKNRDYEESRLKLFFVRESTVLEFGVGVERLPQLLAINVGKTTLPRGYEIKRVWHCPDRRAFAFLIWHPSFDAVAPYCTPPFGEDPFTSVRAILEREEDGRYTLHRGDNG